MLLKDVRNPMHANKESKYENWRLAKYSSSCYFFFLVQLFFFRVKRGAPKRLCVFVRACYCASVQMECVCWYLQLFDTPFYYGGCCSVCFFLSLTSIFSFACNLLVTTFLFWQKSSISIQMCEWVQFLIGNLIVRMWPSSKLCDTRHTIPADQPINQKSVWAHGLGGRQSVYVRPKESETKKKWSNLRVCVYHA